MALAYAVPFVQWQQKKFVEHPEDASQHIPQTTL